MKPQAPLGGLVALLCQAKDKQLCFLRPQHRILDWLVGITGNGYQAPAHHLGDAKTKRKKEEKKLKDQILYCFQLFSLRAFGSSCGQLPNQHSHVHCPIINSEVPRSLLRTPVKEQQASVRVSKGVGAGAKPVSSPGEQCSQLSGERARP